MKFRCNMCGECCRHIGEIDVLKNLDRGDGACRYLIDSKCSIYEDRPIICNVDLMYELHFKNKISKKQYYELNYQGCLELKKGM